ncbi:MAG TPA: hypothetical protein VHN80_28465, partial [Kineosporiaceae bacterium]|nr:hypothetical protein [Kineosporiaceae bacterium]
LFSGCLQLAANRGLLDAGTAAGTQEVRKGRAAFAAELAADVRRCRAVAALAVDPTDPTDPTDRPVP